jgi:hypothetical protein
MKPSVPFPRLASHASTSEKLEDEFDVIAVTQPSELADLLGHPTEGRVAPTLRVALVVGTAKRRLQLGDLHQDAESIGAGSSMCAWRAPFRSRDRDLLQPVVTLCCAPITSAIR